MFESKNNFGKKFIVNNNDKWLELSEILSSLNLLLCLFFYQILMIDI